MPTTICTSLLALLLCAPTAHAGSDDWPEWRGPHHDGVSRETGWTPEGRELWTREVGLGYSAVTVVGGRVYTLGFDAEAEEDVVWCLDAETGEALWTHRYGARIWDKYHDGGSLTTPSIDGDVVYLSNREGHLFCFDAADGDVRWERDVADELGTKPPQWGFSGSPLVLDDALVLNLGRVAAVRKKDGKLLWKTDDYGDAYATPVDFELGKKPAIAVMGGKELVVVDRARGRELATYPWETKYDVNASTPVPLEDGRVFISSGYNHGCAVVDVSKAKAEAVWESKVLRTKMAGAVRLGDHLYGFDESALKCIDEDGNEVWRQRGLGDGAMTIAGGRLVVLSSRGELVVANASPAGFEELSRASVLSGGKYWTTPTVADGRIYCRNNRGQLVARDHRPNKE